MDDIFVPLFAVLGVFVAFPWIIFHYVTKWKTAATITNEDENLLEELHHSGKLKLGDKILLVVPESARFSYMFSYLTVC